MFSSDIEATTSSASRSPTRSDTVCDTSFDYRNLAVEGVGSADGGDLSVVVSWTVGNMGDRFGAEVVELYVTDPEAAVNRPLRELKGIAKISLHPGETAPVRFELGRRDFSYHSTGFGRWLLEPREFGIEIGASSCDLRLTGVVGLDATVPAVALSGMSTLQEWLADPVGGVALRERIGTDNGRGRGILGNEELSNVIGNFPLSTLAAFPGTGIEHDIVDQVLGDVKDPSR